MKEMVTKIAESLGYSNDDLFKYHLNLRLSEVRQVIWYFMRKAGMSYTDIGAMFGVTHSNVLYGVKRIRDLRSVGDNRTIGLFNKIEPFFTNGIND